MFETPDPDDRLQPPHPYVPFERPRPAWGAADLFLFAFFFLLTVIFFPLIGLYAIRLVRPGTNLQNLTLVEQLVLQGLMDIVLVAFIMFLVKVVRRRGFLETIHWYRRHQYSPGALVFLGLILAVTVSLTSALFPSAGQTPIEKMISSAKSLYLFALFGIFVAPTFE